MIYWQLFFAFLRVGLFSVGGGYAAMPLIEHQTVTVYGWITENVFADLVSIAEMTPGPIALNAATFVGMRAAGLPGALVASLGCTVPSLIIVTLLARLYLKYKGANAFENVLSCLRPAVVALIAAAFIKVLGTALLNGLPLALSHIDWLMAALFAAALTLILRFKVNPVLAMLGCGAANLLIETLF